MKLTSIRMGAVALTLLCSLHLYAQNPNNPIQVALLRWYQANTVTSFPTCAGPQGSAFDGAHVWVACISPSELQEFNVNDGSLVRTVSLASAPYFLIYDGANIWATSTAANTVIKVQANTGTVLSTVNVGQNPLGMAFDGAYVWVANELSSSITKIVANTNAVAATYAIACSRPYSIVFDGSIMWVECNAAPSGPSLLGLGSTGNVVTGTPISLGSSPYCNEMAFDGVNVWITSSTAGSATRVNVKTLTATPFTLPSGSSAVAVAFDGMYIWVADTGNNSITKILPSTGAIVGTYSGASSPSFLAFDGGNIWVSNGNNTISKF